MGLTIQGNVADADTVDGAQYAARLADARAALVRARPAPPAERAALVASAQEVLRRTTGVRLPDGTVVAVDDGALALRIDVARRTPPTISDAVLDAAIADLTRLADILSRSTAVDLAAADQRLRQLVGEQRALGGQASLIDGISRWFARFLSSLGGTPPDRRIPTIVAGGIGLALLALVLGILGRDLRERFRREAVLPELVADERVDPDTHLRAAEDALRGGRPRDAVLALYAYAIAVLAARELVRYDPSLTDRELLARARTLPNADALRDLVDLHERVSYGLRDANADDARRARALAMRAVA